MKLGLIDIEKECEELKEVTSPKPKESGKFSKYGLFSQQIFGPVKSDSCACNRITYRGRSQRGTTCERCGVDIVSSEERRRRFAKIELPFEILHPLFYYILIKIKPNLKLILDNLLEFKCKYYYNDDDELTKISINDSIPLDKDILVGLEGVKKLIQKEIENKDKPEMEFIEENIDLLMLKNVIVIPPDFRPCKSNGSGVMLMDTLNRAYRFLIVRSNRVRTSPIPITVNDDIYKTNFKHIQRMVIELFEFILDKMAKREGLIRANILGKRVDFSGRCVISPDPTLRLNECRVPYITILEIMKPQLVTYLVNRRICKLYNQAVKMIEDAIRTKNTELFPIVSEFCKDKVCVLNRQPTLHRLGVLAFRVTVHLGHTIQIHPMVCHPFNADFDGDQMAIYFPITPKSEKDVVNKIGIWNNLISQTDVTLVPQPSQDIILGIYSITQ